MSDDIMGMDIRAIKSGLMSLVVLIGVCLCGWLVINDITEEEKPQPVSAAFLRAEYVKELIEEADESQFAGDAEAATKGQTDLFYQMRMVAEQVYPDADYYQHIGKTHETHKGLVPHSNITYGGYYRVIYVNEGIDR